jgi:hypothetical protein
MSDTTKDVPPLLADLREAQRALRFDWRNDDEYDELSVAESLAWEAWSDYAGDNELCLTCATDTSYDGHAYCEAHREP